MRIMYKNICKIFSNRNKFLLLQLHLILQKFELFNTEIFRHKNTYTFVIYKWEIGISLEIIDYYNCWWQIISKDSRSNITIDWKEIVSDWFNLKSVKNIIGKNWTIISAIRHRYVSREERSSIEFFHWIWRRKFGTKPIRFIDSPSCLDIRYGKFLSKIDGQRIPRWHVH